MDEEFNFLEFCPQGNNNQIYTQTEIKKNIHYGTVHNS